MRKLYRTLIAVIGQYSKATFQKREVAVSIVAKKQQSSSSMKVASLRQHMAVISKRTLILCSVMIMGAMLVGNVAKAQYSYVPVTGFNSDEVAEGTTNTTATTTTTDAVDGTAASSFVFVTPTFRPSAGSSACSSAGYGSTITCNNNSNNTGITYTLQSATGNNALRLAANISGTLTLTTPMSASKLFLVCLGGGGACTFQVVVNFAGGGSQTITALSAPDWCNGGNGLSGINASVLPNSTTGTQFYRIARNATTCTGGTCQFMYEVPVTISAANYFQTINSITVTNGASNFLSIFAVGAQAPCTTPGAQPLSRPEIS